jgi:glycosyltransferase involved in cell wall biosynthesis
LKLSVVIPVYNSRTLSRCLAGIRASFRPVDEIIVVDDGSPEELRPVLDPDIRLIRLNKGPSGPAIARNRGVANASGDVIVFIDSDVVVHPDAIGRIQSVFEEDPELDAVFGSYDDSAEGNVISTFKNLLHHYTHHNARSEATTFWTGLGAIQRKTLLGVGGFDETIRRPRMEDVELGLRLVNAGFRIRLQSDILGTHLKQWTLTSWLKTDWLDRAIPWAEFAARSNRMPNDLNAGSAGRFGAAAVWGSFASSVFLPFPWSLIVPVAGCACAVSLHHSLIRLFYRKGGFRRTLVQAMLLILYLAYASLVFVSAFLYFKFISPSNRGDKPAIND